MTDLEERIARFMYRATQTLHQLTIGKDLPNWEDADDSRVKQASYVAADCILDHIKAQEKTDDQST